MKQVRKCTCGKECPRPVNAKVNEMGYWWNCPHCQSTLFEPHTKHETKSVLDTIFIAIQAMAR